MCAAVGFIWKNSMVAEQTRISIANRTKLSDLAALMRVETVVKMGKISKTRETPHYCFVTHFDDCRVSSGLSRAGTIWFVVEEL
jgi:hypothetical protein